MPATDDAALARLLDAYGQAEYEFGQVAERVAFNPAAVRRIYDRKEAACAALLDYLAEHYVRRAPLAQIAARYARWYADDADEANAALDDIDRLARAALEREGG